MKTENIKKAAAEVSRVAYYLIIGLLVVEVIVAHWLAYLYLNNFRMEIVPVVKVVSPL